MATHPTPSRRAVRMRRIASLALLTTLLAPARGQAAGAAGDRVRRTNTAPNIVIILTDDQRWDSLSLMPHVQADLVSQGMTFQNAFVSNPLCCPSRSSILTGNYSHTTGVYLNFPPHGGWPAFHDLGAETSTIATWLHDAGYHTSLVGKYLNVYGPDNTFVPPGWDRWVAFEDEHAYYDYRLNVDGSLVSYGHDAGDYSTDVLAEYAVADILSVPSDQPLFLYLSTTAPHGPIIPAPRDIGTVLDGPSTWPPSFNERDMRDKPGYLRGIPRVSKSSMSSRYVRTAESLGAVDDAVHEVVDALESAGRLENTLIVFASDNGIGMGEHRWAFKLVPYEESIRIPLVMRWDGVVALGALDRHVVANIDLAPTFADAAGVTPPMVDGRSMLPLLRGHDPAWRKRLLLENLWYDRTGGPSPPTYCGVRSQHRVFVHYGSGFEEYYDVNADPYELRNAIGRPSHGWIGRLRRATRRLCQPRPPGMPPF